MKTILLAIAIGALSGAIAALCGVGGGIVMVPFFTILLGMQQKVAVATSLAAIVFTAVFATAKNHSNQLIDWRIAIASGVAGAVVAWFSADALKVLSNTTLTRVFAVTMIAVGIRMLLQK